MYRRGQKTVSQLRRLAPAEPPAHQLKELLSLYRHPRLITGPLERALARFAAAIAAKDGIEQGSGG
jgi:hypothetical protein